jgi:hypothetical protein
MLRESLLRSLAESGKRAAVDGDAAIDWDLPASRPRWLSERAYRTAISQLYYGERATIDFCEMLATEISDPPVRRFLATQIADERRHMTYYERYLARVGGIGDIEEGVAMAYEGARAWPGSYHGAILAFHVVLEGEGLRIQRLYGDWFPCPLFQQINKVIARDEGRHIGFGRHVLRASLAALPADERAAMYRWIRDLWFECAGAIRAEMPRSVSLLVGRAWAEERWQRQRQTLCHIGLMRPDETDVFDRV